MINPWQGRNPDLLEDTAGMTVPEPWSNKIMEEFKKGLSLQAKVMREYDLTVARKEPYT